jgi:hypothetical protein
LQPRPPRPPILFAISASIFLGDVDAALLVNVTAIHPTQRHHHFHPRSHIHPRHFQNHSFLLIHRSRRRCRHVKFTRSRHAPRAQRDVGDVLRRCIDHLSSVSRHSILYCSRCTCSFTLAFAITLISSFASLLPSLTHRSSALRKVGLQKVIGLVSLHMKTSTFRYCNTFFVLPGRFKWASLNRQSQLTLPAPMLVKLVYLVSVPSSLPTTAKVPQHL